jgi:hypothetical protein
MKSTVVGIALLLVSSLAAASPAPCGSTPSVAGIITPKENPPRNVYLGDYVTVVVCHLDVFLADAAAREEQVTLYVDGVDTGNTPVAVDRDAGTIKFTLDRTKANDHFWRLRLYDPVFTPEETIAIGIGKAADRTLPKAPGANTHVTLRKVYVDWTTWIWLALLVAIVVAVIVVAARTDLLRDNAAVGGVRQPYSLARTQMAWWFLLTVFGFMFIWMVTGDHDSLPPSLLGLMGISAATAVAAVAIPTGGAAAAMRKRLEDELAAIDLSLGRIDADLASNTHPDVVAALTRARDAQQAMRARVLVEMSGLTSVIASRGFWHDLVCDERGAVALDRLQIVVWTLVLGFIFFWNVGWTLSMPEFSATMLALMGISSGTYLGFKLPNRT